ncbi:MAG: ATPase [Thermotogae bacterium]|nr:ATPase [Thermotogota bacterium]
MKLLGVDVGGTKTDAIVVDETGHILGWVRGGSGNYQTVGVERAFKEINDTIEKVLEKVGVDKDSVDFAYFGVAGADFSYDLETIRSILERIGLKKYDFDNDGRIALKAGTIDDVGIMVSCGTGSISYASDGKRLNRIGGFSPFFGERLGSYHVAGMVASTIVRSLDGRSPKTVMKELVEDRMGESITDLMKYDYDGHEEKIREMVITLLESLSEAAQKYDYGALKIFMEIIDEVLKIVQAHLTTLRFETRPIKLVLEGTFFKKVNRILVEMLKSALGNDFTIVIPEHDPVIGAVLLAMESAGIEPGDNEIHRLISEYLKMKKEVFG